MSDAFSLPSNPINSLKQKPNKAIGRLHRCREIDRLGRLFRNKDLTGRALRLLYDYALHAPFRGKNSDLELLLAISIARAQARKKRWPA